MKNFDAVIIGAGPAGINAALYMVRAGFSVALVEKKTPGGQILGTAEIENYLGFPKGIKGYEMADTFSAHLDQYPVERIFGDVIAMEEVKEGELVKHKLILDENKEELLAPVVIIATGVRYRNLGVDGEHDFQGKGVSYCALCDGNFYRDLNVIVVGGGNSALEESLYLSRIARKVYLVHRRDKFKGDKIYLEKIMAMPEKIEIVTDHVIESLQGSPNLQKVVVKNVKTDELREIEAEGLFVYVGNIPNSAFLPSHFATNDKGFIVTDQEMRTETPGVYAAGDIRDKACRQVCSAVGDGATAATAAIVYLEQI